MDITSKHKKIYMFSFYMVVFAGLFVFFAQIHPLYVFDADDWANIVLRRGAFPTWKLWNPVKVLPETLMPLVAEMGVRIFMPLTKDYIEAMAIAFALVISVIFTIYFYFFCECSARIYTTENWFKLIMSTFIILMHFLPFMKMQTAKFMYLAGSVNNTFNYTIPALLNTTLVLFFVNNNIVKEIDTKTLLYQPKLKNGFLLLLLYLAVNSNILHSILLISYIISVLVINFIKELWTAKKVGINLVVQFAKKYILWIAVILIWLISLFMESQGGRASNLKFQGNYLSELWKRLKELSGAVKGLNHSFQIIVVVIMGVALFLFLMVRKEKTSIDKEYIHLSGQFFISLLITTIYLVLLTARTGAGYLSGCAVFSGILFYVFLLMWISLIYIAKKLPIITCLMPMAIYVLLFATLVNMSSYEEMNIANHPAEVVKQIDDEILDWVLQAEQRGESVVEVYVPDYGQGQNWPVSLYSGGRIADALYAHGVTGKKMEIIIVPSKEINQKYDLN